MAEYYVVRDKNTGLYFRGKGVNRWGKYYNQASIYRIKANAENTIKEVSWKGEQAEIVPIQIVETTADVVPKSEVEKLYKEIDRLSQVVLYHDSFKADEIKDARQEVAREIFAEIAEKLEGLFDFFRQDGCIRESSAIMLAISEIAELKKKHTEGE